MTKYGLTVSAEQDDEIYVDKRYKLCSFQLFLI